MQIDDWIVHEIPEHVITEASDWIVQLDRLQSDDYSTAMKQSNCALEQQFYDWLNHDLAHQIAFLQLSETWAKMSMLKHMEHLIEHSEVLSFPALCNLPLVELEAHLTATEHTQTLSTPTWMYGLAIGLIVAGMLAPIFL